MKFLTVDVTQEDIDKGQTPWHELGSISYSRAQQCPLGIALKRMGHEAHIIGKFAYIDGNTVNLGPKVRAFVDMADKHFASIDGYRGPNSGLNTVTPLPQPKPKPARFRVRYA